MIDPSGDAQHAGRKLYDSFERGINLQCAEQLKTILEQTYSGLRVILTRFPGETLEPLQKPNFANRLAVDLYISLASYQEAGVTATLSLYYFCNEEFVVRSGELCFCPYDKVHVNNQHITQKYIEQVKQFLSQESSIKKCEVYGPFGIPYKPLLGIESPAFALELGLTTPQDVKILIPRIAESLDSVIQELARNHE